MGLLIRGAGHSHSLRCDGRFCQFPHYLPSLDIFCSSLAIPFLPGTGLCFGLCPWLVIDSWRPQKLYGRHSLVTNRKLYDYYSFLTSWLFHLHLYFELILLETQNPKPEVLFCSNGG